ncbi:acyl-CoA dehydrogenase [Serratia sp. RJAL6]|uniref:acyl-CoA dehydrogenase family protein n=1 Tax=Serratia marcescens TaxID=615 RepID=UPI0011F108E5|nr:acyl-CoA dehydrogenase family protein [Serratia marcescens]KAB5496529.1 acyl-CoA dehydrogenase [Enterobacter sp. RJAL6]
MLNNTMPCNHHAILQGFIAQTNGRDLLELESLPPQQIKALIAQSQLPALIIPTRFGGLGMPLADALEIVHFIAGVCPSAALMLCMHYHVVSTVAAYPQDFPFAERLLSDIAENGKLMASAFAESTGNQDIFHTSVIASLQADGGLTISGSKKPCTMSHIADYYAVSVITEQGTPGIAIIAGAEKGLSRNAFWPGDVLVGTDSHEIIFNNVQVARTWTVLAEDEAFEMYLNTGLVNFNLFVGAAYTGVCQRLTSHLVPQALQAPAIGIPLLGILTQCFYSVRGLADKVHPENLTWLVPGVLALRYRIQTSLKEAKSIVFENIGAQRYLTNDAVHYLAKTVDLLAFHPVTRFGFEQQLKK